MRRILNDAMISVAALATLLFVLVLVDDRVREQLVRTVRGVSGEGIDGSGAAFGDVAPILLAAARDQSLAHGPMVVFVAVAVVLFICMVRA